MRRKIILRVDANSYEFIFSPEPLEEKEEDQSLPSAHLNLYGLGGGVEVFGG